MSQLRKIERDMQASGKRMEGQWARVGSTISRGLVGAVGALASGRALCGVGNLASEVGNLGEAAAQAGTDVGNLQALISSGIGVGLNQDNMVRFLAPLNERLAEAMVKGNDLGRVLEASSIKIQNANGSFRDTVDLLKDIADLMRDAESAQERAFIGKAVRRQGF